MASKRRLTAKMEPFDSFWEGPEDIEKGYGKFYKFYAYNYLPYLPKNKDVNILVISCGPGYFVNLANKKGYRNVTGIDSYPDKIKKAKDKGLNCIVADAFEYLEAADDGSIDVIFCEQELNHLTKDEIIEFLNLCAKKMRPKSTLISHVLNGANPITGAEALAQNFDHYNTFTEYTLRQVQEHCGFQDVKVIPLQLYVFFTNPLNYVLWAASILYTLFFRASFIMYGKNNKIFTKKIAAISKSPG